MNDMQKQYKKILVIINGGLPIPSIKGGAIETLINMFIDNNELDKKYDITICSNYAKNIEEKAENYKNTHFYYIDTNSIKYKTSYALRGLIRRIFKVNIKSAFTKILLKKFKNTINDYDMILVENYISCINPISKKYNGKIVARLHNDSIINAKYHDGKTIIDNCYKILTVSDFIKKRVNGVKNSNKVEVVYNGINQSKFKPNEKEKYILRKKYNLNKEDIVFLFSGRVCEEKGIMPLAKAFKNISKKYDNCKLMIVGASFYSSNMNTKFIKQLKKELSDVEDKIIFTGYIPYDEMPKIYQMADVLVVPSLYEEALSLTLVEGMSSKLPVIISDSGGMPEVVTKKNSFIAKRNNIEKELEGYMLKLIESKELRNKMGIASVERSKRFSEEAYLKRFWQVIDEILK